NKSAPWAVSLVLHLIVIGLVSLAAAGLSNVTLLTDTTVYVVADVSHSSERNLDEIDARIREISQNLPERTKMGVVAFGKNCVITTSVGRTLTSVKDSGVDDSATDIAKALDFTEGLFKGDSLKKIILITDGNDTVSRNVGTIASTVERLTENGVQVDAIFLDNTLKEGDQEVQLLEVEHASTTYLGNPGEAKLLIQSSANAQVMLELYSRVKSGEGDFEKLSQSVITVEQGLTTATVTLPAEASETYEYKAVLTTDRDTSPVNNQRVFAQKVVGQERILLITGNHRDEQLIQSVYSADADIDSHVVTSSGARVPFRLEELVEYDEIVLSNVDVRNIRNANAFLDSVDMVVSQYGKSLVTVGDLLIQTNADDALLIKLSELLPVSFGSTRRDGRLYTIVLDVSNSMYMASKFTVVKQAARQLISVLDEDDYVCLVEFSGDVKVRTAEKVKDCKKDLLTYIDNLSIGHHGTDIGLGLEEALKVVRGLNLTENQIMLISDGFSFQNQYDAVEIAASLHESGALVSGICTYIQSEGDDGLATLGNITKVGGGTRYVISRPEDVAGVVFGQVAEDFSAAIVEKDAAVTVAKYRDPITQGLSGLPNVSGFILSLEKYDATVPLTVTYQKSNNYQETVPLYAYRPHGNGRIASFTGSLDDSWTRHWSAEDRSTFVTNMLMTNTPTERMEVPFTVHVERTDYDAYLEIVPSVLNPKAVLAIRIKAPNGKITKRELTFDSTKYAHTFETKQIGTYTVEITYSYDDQKFESVTAFEIPYTTEYNEFATCDKFNVYAFMRGNGEIYVNELPDLSNDESAVTTYRQSYAIPLLIAAASIFVVDIFVRKLRVKRKSTKKRTEQAPRQRAKTEKGGT
ncbi:MAG: VWA domain-containing protein, partial [Clostridia bacterium]|nr:VWA domain-containing protein [Clostridia bacterium]